MWDMNYFKEARSLFATREGDAYVKETDHHMRHSRSHLGDRASAKGTRGLRMARRSIWTRAKHRVGLERPHFCTRFRGQIDPRGRSSPRGDSFRCFARECRRILKRNMRRKRVNKVKTVRITLCTFRTATSSPNARPTKFILKRFPTNTLAKVNGQNKANRAGATPLFGSQSAQKFCPGRSRPLLHSGAHVFFAKGEADSFLAVKSSSSGEVGFTTLLHRNLTCYFTLDRARHLRKSNR